ncbi:hypothetical protein K461DRAFT_26899 [Myriangium duriaei CBS 260.36]|uniref:Uncharacterized protein n=1 Tax=Myriangium duriaei CBS 260.36 TaxID=1168546 RepID=A0A9P4MSW0_9PEZI|nr:hypothetical protein K461DRAFT_26899 [Myriangium duriaei CBS 260.36]
MFVAHAAWPGPLWEGTLSAVRNGQRLQKPKRTNRTQKLYSAQACADGLERVSGRWWIEGFRGFSSWNHRDHWGGHTRACRGQGRNVLLSANHQAACQFTICATPAGLSECDVSTWPCTPHLQSVVYRRDLQHQLIASARRGRSNRGGRGSGGGGGAAGSRDSSAPASRVLLAFIIGIGRRAALT